MDNKTVRDVFEELLPSLEALDTKCAAILQFLKNKGIANDDELAPFSHTRATQAVSDGARPGCESIICSPAQRKMKDRRPAKLLRKNHNAPMLKHPLPQKAQSQRAEEQKNTKLKFKKLATMLPLKSTQIRSKEKTTKKTANPPSRKTKTPREIRIKP